MRIQDRYRVLLIRLLVGGLLILSLVRAALTAIDPPFFWPPLVSVKLQLVLLAVIWFGSSALALVLMIRTAHRRDSRILAICVSLVALGVTFAWGETFLGGHALRLDYDPVVLTLKDRLGFVGRWGFYVLPLAAFVHFALAFPDEVRSVRKPRRVLGSPLLPWFVAALLLLLLYWLTTYRPGNHFLEVFGLSVRKNAVFIPVFLGAALGGMAYGVGQLRNTYVVVDEATRKKTRWVVTGFVWGCLTLAFVFGLQLLMVLSDPLRYWLLSGAFARRLLPDLLLAFPALLQHIAVLCIGLCLVIAFFYSDTFDAGPVFRRTTVYGLLGALGIFLLAGLEGLVSNILANVLGLPQAAEIWIIGGLVALVLTLLREPLIRTVNRLFPEFRAPTRS